MEYNSLIIQMKQKKKNSIKVKIIHNHVFEMKISTISCLLFYFLFHLYPIRINQFQLLINLPLQSGYIYIYICES